MGSKDGIDQSTRHNTNSERKNLLSHLIMQPLHQPCRVRLPLLALFLSFSLCHKIDHASH